VLMYDYACGAQEFCVNREGEYYKDTFFSHDVSPLTHTYTHTHSLSLSLSLSLSSVDSSCSIM
jgi:hypothetical protein